MSKLRALSGRISEDWNQRPFMISGKVLNDVLNRRQNKIARLCQRYGTKIRPSKFWTKQKLFDLLCWIVFAGGFTGLSFVAASVLDGYLAAKSEKAVTSEVWTQTADGKLIPMKEAK